MKRLFLFSLLSLAVASNAFAFAKKPASPKPSASPAVKKYYMCPMRCQLMDKPGKCPKCGMEMWEVSAS